MGGGMDIDGLQTIIEHNHEENQKRFDEMVRTLKATDGRVTENTKFIDRIKTIGTLFVILYTLILGWIKLGK
jgi:hypothetical protein